MKSERQTAQTSISIKRIRRRLLKHGKIKKIKLNKNGPKFILGHCLLSFKNLVMQQSSPEAKNYLKQSFSIMERWVAQGEKDKLTMNHLKELVGKGNDNQQENLRFLQILQQALAGHHFNQQKSLKCFELSYMHREVHLQTHQPRPPRKTTIQMIISQPIICLFLLLLLNYLMHGNALLTHLGFQKQFNLTQQLSINNFPNLMSPPFVPAVRNFLVQARFFVKDIQKSLKSQNQKEKARIQQDELKTTKNTLSDLFQGKQPFRILESKNIIQIGKKYQDIQTNEFYLCQQKIEPCCWATTNTSLNDKQDST